MEKQRFEAREVKKKTEKQVTTNTKKKKYNLYLLSAVFIAQVLVGPSKQLKQIIQI